MTADNRVILDYTSRDYKAIRSTLVGLAQGFTPEWTTVGETGDFGTLLLELFAYNGDILNYYIDRVGAEAFLGTATRRQSVMFIADMLGYTPIGQQAATVPLAFTWQWDTAATQIASVSYAITEVKTANGVVSLKLTHPDTSVELEAGQTISVPPSVDHYTGAISGSYVIESVVPATDTTPFIASFLLPEATVVSDADWGPPGPGAVVTTGTTVLIPADTLVTSTADSLGQAVNFELDADVLLDSALATKVGTMGYVGTNDPSTVYSVTAVGTATEGITVDPVSIGISKGIPNADLVVSDIGVIDGTVKVYTKEGGAAVVWSRIKELAVAGPDQSVFSYYVDDNGSTHILFGDNASGRIPPVNSEIFVGYRVGVGANANSLEIGSVTTLNFDYATGFGVTVTNTAAPTGGSDVESVESMRFSVPRANAVRQRGVSLDDYRALALQVPGVAKALAYGDSYTSVFLRIAASAASRAYITDRTPFIKTGQNTIKVVTSDDHSSDLHPGDKVFLSTHNATGSYVVGKVWEAQPTNLIPITQRSMSILTHAQYPSIATNQSSATLVCTEPHGLVPGQPFRVQGVDAVGDPQKYDGVWIVGSVPDTDRKTLTYHCPQFHQDNLSLDGTLTDYTSPESSATLTAGHATLTAYSGLELSAPGIATSLFHPTAQPGPSAAPNLSFSDPQMRALIEATEAYLSDKDLVGAKVYAEPVEWCNAILAVNVTVRDLYNRTSVKNAVRDAIKNVFAFDNVDFGQRITLGEVYRAALAVDGVEFANISSMYIGDRLLTVSAGLTPNGDPTDPGVIVEPTPGVGDIVTPARSIPRLDPVTSADDDWITATGGLVNT